MRVKSELRSHCAIVQPLLRSGYVITLHICARFIGGAVSMLLCDLVSRASPLYEPEYKLTGRPAQDGLAQVDRGYSGRLDWARCSEL